MPHAARFASDRGPSGCRSIRARGSRWGRGWWSGGTLGFLPVLGFWMIPLGLLVLSQDLPVVRRWRRNFVVRMERRGARRPARKTGRNDRMPDDEGSNPTE